MIEQILGHREDASCQDSAEIDDVQPILNFKCPFVKSDEHLTLPNPASSDAEALVEEFFMLCGRQRYSCFFLGSPVCAALEANRWFHAHICVVK